MGWFVAIYSIRVFWSSRNLDSTGLKAWHGAQLKDDFSDVTRKQNGNVGRFFILCFTFVVLGMSCAMMITNQGLFIYSLFPPFDMSLGWSPNVPLRLTTWFNTISFMWYWDSDTECAITNLLVHSTEHPWIRARDCFAETYENHWKPTMERAVMDLWIGDWKNTKLWKNSSWLQIQPLCLSTGTTLMLNQPWIPQFAEYIPVEQTFMTGDSTILS